MKTFIVAPNHINKLDLANNIVALNDNINICKSFTSDIKAKGIVGQYKFGLDIDNILLAFKNNALLYLDFRDEEVSGLTLDDYDASDIIVITTAHFNDVPDIYLT